MAGGIGWAKAQQPPAAPAGQAQQGRGGGFGGGRGNAGPAIFTVVDANKDGAVTRDELKATFDRWFTEWDSAKTGALTQEQLLTGLNASLPAPAPGGGGGFPGGGRGAQPQNQTPNPAHVQAMLAALPAAAPAKPRQPRRVLVLGKAAGFVHSSIPIAARTIEEMGKKTGAWSTTITYDAADINEANLKQYDAIFLASTTGAFLDDPNDAAATAARRKALLDFVRGGKGLAGIHAATDSYHQNRPSTDAPAGGARAAGPGGGGRGGGRGGQGGPVVAQFLAQGDKNADQKISRDEFTALADAWYTKLDTTNSGRVAQADFPQRFTTLFPPPAPPALGRTGFPIQGPATNLEPDNQVGTWPEFNTMIGGFFKFHWNDGQEIHVKVDEPNHPLNAAFRGKPQLLIVDETYTFGRETYSRKNLRVLTSVDYAKMSDEDKKKESNPRADGDYALSWIRREGKGRVFYEAHGHNEKIYAITPILEHVLAGMQYVLGDLQADDSPSQK
jgi:type 1 glutamine amidotransferase